MRRMLSKFDYINEIEQNLRNAGRDKNCAYSEEYIQERLNHVKCTDIDKVFKSRGYKYLVNFYMERDPEKIECRDIGCYTYAMTVDNGDGTYDVTFAFLHPVDLTKEFVYSDYKKYLVRNYYLKKFRFDGIKSVTRTNAICIAVNKNSSKFPSWHRHAKIQPKLAFCGDFNAPKPVLPESPFAYPEVLVKVGEVHKTLKKEMQDVYGVSANDVRYYNDCSFMKMMAVKKNGFQVTFSFVSPADRYLMNTYCHNDGIRSMVDKNMLMKNYISGKYTYTCPTGVSSMDTIVRVFNKNHKSFPNWARNIGMCIVFDWEHKDPKYNRM